ncbi:MAG: protein kinase domain-containing protein [Gemmatimonadaceae bacterium]
MLDEVLERLRAATAGEYEIVRELGRGGFATVYLARDVSLERDVAIKVLSPQTRPDDPESAAEVERFRREARTVAKLNHPHVIPVYAVRATEGLQYFVMKFIRGRSLEGVLASNGRLSFSLVQTILQQAGSALAYAHKNGVVHRDIKPANIMLDEEGWAVVADFGIAKVARAEKLTGTGLIVGTAAYMSPEQWAGHDVTGLSDEYSLGCVAYELITGVPPYAGDTITALLWAHLNEVPVPITEQRPDCPEALERIVMRMLEKEPSARYPSLEEAVHAIGALAVTQAPEETRTQLMSLATVTGSAITVRTDGSGERVIDSGPNKPITPSGKVAKLAVSPSTANVAVGATLRLTATPLNDTGRQLARRATAWHSMDAAVATVDADGVITARGRGATEIVATCEGVEIRVPVTVTASGRIAATAVTTPRNRLGPALAGAALVVAVASGVMWQQGVFRNVRNAVSEDSTLVPAGNGTPAGDTGANATDPTGRPPGGQPNAAGTPASETAQKRETQGQLPLAGAPTANAATTSQKSNAPGGVPGASTVVPAGGTAANPAGNATTTGSPNTPAGTPGNAPANASPTVPNATPGSSPSGTPSGAPSGVSANAAAAGGETRANPDVAGALEGAVANPVAEISAGATETCASLASGDRVWCWGGSAPAGSVLASVYFEKLAVGGGHTCGLTAEGAAFCWGDNSQGQLGDDTRSARSAPTPVKTATAFSDISVGAAHTCALAKDGSAWCWGSNKAGQLGDNSLNNRPRPVLVRGQEKFQSLSAGGSHTCGVRANKLYCWGDGFSGQIGNAIQDNQREPYPVKTAAAFRSVVTGELHTCGLTISGRAWCWGDNRRGQLGNDTHDNRDVPDSVATELIFTQLSAGASHTCGITSTRALACWGDNGAGQLGNGSRQRSEIPVVIMRVTQWKKVSVGAAHTCAITRSDAVYCWGANSRGQLGAGAAGGNLLVPTPIKVTPRS